MAASKIYPTVFPNHRGTATVELSVTARPPAANRARRGCAKATAKTGSGRCNRCRSAPEIFDGKMLKMKGIIEIDGLKHTSGVSKNILEISITTKWRSGKCFTKKKVHLKMPPNWSQSNFGRYNVSLESIIQVKLTQSINHVISLKIILQICVYIYIYTYICLIYISTSNKTGEHL